MAKKKRQPLLQPLTPEQIEWYFEQAGPDLVGVHKAPKHDETLQELLNSKPVTGLQLASTKR